MDSSLLFIIIGSAILFAAIIVWKLRWFYKKIIEAEKEESDDKS